MTGPDRVRRPRRISARTILGVPFIPPATVTEIASRLRASVGRLHRWMAPPPVQIIESALSLLAHRVLVTLCAAGVPDALRAPMTMAQLSATTSVDVDRLERLVRFAAARGWLVIDRHGRVGPTRVTEFLRADHPAGWRAWVDFMAIDGVVAAIEALDARSSADAFLAANGKPFFEWMAERPADWTTFDAAMGAGARMHALTIDAVVDWRGVESVCDVGGGTGELLAALLDRHPRWRGAVFDLPAVIDRAQRRDRLERIAGDAFVNVPIGFDAYLLVNVLHDWCDADAERILRNVGAALQPRGRVFVVDSNRRAVPLDELGLSADMLMAALTNGGRERDAAAFASIGAACELHLHRTSSLASGDLLHEFRRAP